MTTIEKIKAEIERQKEINKRLLDGQLRDGCLYAYNQVRSFISALEAEKPVPNDLEEASEEYASDYPAYNDDQMIAKYSFKRGVEWQKEQMLKEAVEGTVVDAGFDNNTALVSIPDKRYDEGDKVRIIIVKEEKK